jgi:integrase
MAGTAQPYFWKARNAWYVNVTVNGKPTKRKLADTKTKAFDVWKAGLKTATENKTNPMFLTVGTLWLETQANRFERGEVSKTWLARVKRTVVAFAAVKGVKTCQDITPALADKWIAGMSSNYARTELAVIKQILRWAVSRKILTSNPLDGQPLPPTKARQRILSVEEHNTLCRASTRKFKPLLRFAWMVGCRPGELRELRWSQLDKDFGRAVMAEHKSDKTGKPRVIYFPDRAQKILRAVKTSKTDRRAKSGFGEDFVFWNHRRKQWTKNAVVCRMKEIRKVTGLDVVAYNYRHTWITRALLSGVDIATVAVLSGHSSVAMIAKTYGHLDQHSGHLRDAASKVK